MSSTMPSTMSDSESETDEFFYIAGPMSGYPNHNIPAFMNAENYLVSIGVPGKQIFNPAKHEGSLMVQQGLVKDTQEAYRMCLKLDMNWICDHATCLYMLDGWERSYGARAEHTLAQALGLRFIYQN